MLAPEELRKIEERALRAEVVARKWADNWCAMLDCWMHAGRTIRRLREERDAARAAVAQMVEAWESVDGCPRNTMLEIATEYTARYPREKREEAGR